MKHLPPEWRDYARAQASLSDCSRVGRRASGLEAALNDHLDQLTENPSVIPSSARATKAQAAAESREAYRRRVRLRIAEVAAESLNPEPAVIARDTLRRLFKLVTSEEAQLVIGAAKGMSSMDLGQELGLRSAAVRKRLERAREKMMRLAA